MEGKGLAAVADIQFVVAKDAQFGTMDLASSTGAFEVRESGVSGGRKTPLGVLSNAGEMKH